MIVHIVLGTARETLTARDEEELYEAIARLGRIPGVVDMSWGADFSGRALGYTHAAVLRLTDRTALAAYLQNPAHLEVVAVLNRLLPDRLVFDYETGSNGSST